MAAKDRLKSRILRMLKEDEEFRYAVAGLIGLEEILKRLDRHEDEVRRIWQEIEKLREDMNKLREDMMKMFEKHEERFARIEQELVRLREDMMRGFELMDKRITRLENLISALGARWGIMAEDAFREGLRGILEKEFGVKVERWVTRDEEGLVYGFSSVIEVDIAIKDGKTMLIEISSSVDKSKVAAFLRKAQLYERKTGIKPDRLVMVTPYAEDAAIKAAREMGVEIYTTAS
ncbi:MAG: DUF3782 domain-containing protein [Candidatus Calditenuis sp.]|nr:DUF3782 domain-containing protein [Candidatus Calditenuis sp.]MDT7968665.1 DUF3782 domain-containing protein [Candidatus Calditenuis sp.]